MILLSKIDVLKYNVRDTIRIIEKEKSKPQNDLTRYYIREFTKVLEDLKEQIREEEKRLEDLEMKRVGFFTGKIYDETTNPNNIKECCRVMYDDNKLEDENYLSDLRKELKEKCKNCQGSEECEKYKNKNIEGD